MPKIHIVGHAVVVAGQFVRQLCAWCGERLVDEDLSLLAVPEGQGYNPFWAQAALLEVGENYKSVVQPPADGTLPPGCCANTPPPNLPTFRLRLVEDRTPEQLAADGEYAEGACTELTNESEQLVPGVHGEQILASGKSEASQAPLVVRLIERPGAAERLAQQVRCDHKFVDSKCCLKCGWAPPERGRGA